MSGAVPYPRSSFGPIDPLSEMYKGINDCKDSDILCLTFHNGGVLLFDVLKKRLGSTYDDLSTCDVCLCKNSGNYIYNNDNININSNSNINSNIHDNSNNNDNLKTGITKKMTKVGGDGIINWCTCGQDKYVLEKISDIVSTPTLPLITLDSSKSLKNNNNVNVNANNNKNNDIIISDHSKPSAAVLPPWPGGICVVSDPTAGQIFSLKFLDLSRNPLEVSKDGDRHTSCNVL